MKSSGGPGGGASSSCGNPLLREHITGRSPILVFGQAATGKTHLAVDMALCAGIMGMRPLIHAVENSTRVYLAHHDPGIPYTTPDTMDQLVEEATRASLEGMYQVVDTINTYYRSSPGMRLGSMMSYIMALLRETGGVAVAQVAGSGLEASGIQYLAPWARLVLRLNRGPGGVFLVEVLKPKRRIYAFRVHGGRITWI